MVIIIPIVGVIDSPVIIIRAAGILVAMVRVRVLHIAAAAPLRHDSGMIGALHRDAPVSAQGVMNVHAALRIVE
jgi:hypothetical protein